MIADSLGIEDPKQTNAGLSPEEKRVLAVSLNVDRRHLTDGQQVVIGKKIEPDIAKIAKRRQLATLRRGDQDGSPLSTDDDNGSIEKEYQKKTIHKVAMQVGLGSGKTYHLHKKVLGQVEQEAPELMPYIENGDLTIAEVKKELKRRCPTPAAPSTRVGQWPPTR